MIFALEIIGTLFALFGVWLTARQHVACWPVALVAVLIYCYVFFQSRLYGDSSLQAFYLIMSLYGWYEWLYGGKDHSTLTLSHLNLQTFVITSCIGVGAAALFAYFLQMTDADLPWVDATTTAFSLIATWMMAKKIVHSWIYWIVIDSVYVGMMVYKGLYVTSFQYLAFTLLAVYGLRLWVQESFKYETETGVNPC